MPFGELVSCVWLVLLALTLMTTYPRYFYCSCSSTPSSSSPSPSNTVESQSSQPEQHSATAAIFSNFCHHSINTSESISTDCHKQQEPRMRITGEINEGPGPPPSSCPTPCSSRKGRSESTRSEKNSSCYRYLMQKDCEEPWLNDWSEIRLRHCCEHSVQESVPDADVFLNDRQQCERYVNELLELDVFVAKVTCQFRQVLMRYDCQQKYSVNNCESCMNAYRRWVCASLIPHWKQRHKIKPCRSICHIVEQNCPWFLPADKNPGYPAQYAGEPIFQCIDANIPETGAQLEKSTYGTGCCYEYCEQYRNTEVSTSSYHHLDKSKFSFKRIVSCERGCNNSTNDPSQGASSPCQNPLTTSTTASSASPTTGKDKNEPLPFVNFPLSSCPSAKSSHGAGSAQHSGSHRNLFSNVTALWIVFYLLIANMRLGLSDLR